ncbi:hypothetical protein [Alicyclobacillus dauci]|uniref:Uncharacterized protein n=1 Tax=Alicyclobacillus dauci TaxID=1475485 RepID=A0ABY6YZX6_9BACL|nr:hypothetical protein [Alicyclobacillus dauci]WAH35270.1 hypothetical protein NZD86_13220 [Alicyclobacillus dauci]
MLFGWRRKRIEEEVLQRLDRIAQVLAVVSDKVSEHKVQITIETLHVDKASLEQLSFKLDHLDIDELSGSLNLGNNFGTDINRVQKDVQVRKDKLDEKQNTTAQSEPESVRSGRMEKHEHGYKVSLHN